jgi:hypothetical protein
MDIPGKIPFIKRATIDVVPSTVELVLDNNAMYNETGHYQFTDNVDNASHVLTLSGKVSELYIENMPVHHLLVGNTLEFTTPIYKWLFTKFDNK